MENNLENKAKLVFEYTDEFGDLTKIEKTFDVSIISETDGLYEYIIQQFQGFLKQAEFDEKKINDLIF